MKILKNLKDNNLEEIWVPCYDPKDKFDWRPYYLVSQYGRVKSIERYVMVTENRRRRVGGNILKEHQRGGKHVSVDFKVTIEGISHIKTAYPHRYVAIAFIPNPMAYPFVSHKRDKDGYMNYKDNHVMNLIWANQSMVSKATMVTYPRLKDQLKRNNIKSGYYTNRRLHISDESVDMIKDLRSKGYILKHIAELTKVSISTVHRLCDDVETRDTLKKHKAMLNMRREGYTVKYIADHYQITEDQVRRCTKGLISKKKVSEKDVKAMRTWRSKGLTY